jgi:hypothetical protein
MPNRGSALLDRGEILHSVGRLRLLPQRRRGRKERLEVVVLREPQHDNFLFVVAVRQAYRDNLFKSGRPFESLG